jgi:hypothetical protein
MLVSNNLQRRNAMLNFRNWITKSTMWCNKRSRCKPNVARFNRVERLQVVS